MPRRRTARRAAGRCSGRPGPAVPPGPDRSPAPTFPDTTASRPTGKGIAAAIARRLRICRRAPEGPHRFSRPASCVPTRGRARSAPPDRRVGPRSRRTKPGRWQSVATWAAPYTATWRLAGPATSPRRKRPPAPAAESSRSLTAATLGEFTSLLCLTSLTLFPTLTLVPSSGLGTRAARSQTGAWEPVVEPMADPGLKPAARVGAERAPELGANRPSGQ